MARRKRRSNAAILIWKSRIAKLNEAKIITQSNILKANNDTNESNSTASENSKASYDNTIIESSLSVGEPVKNEPEEPIAKYINTSNYWDLEDDVDGTEDKLDSQNTTRSSIRIAKKKLTKAKPEEECAIIGFITKKRKYNSRRKQLPASTQNDIWRTNSVRISNNLMKLKKQSKKAHFKTNKQAHKCTPFFVSKAKISSNFQEMEGTTGYFTDALYEEINTKCGNCSYVFANENEKSKKFVYCHKSRQISDVQILDGIFSIYGLTAQDWTRALLPNCEFTADCDKCFDEVSFCENCVSCLQNVYESHQILKSVSDQHSAFARTISFKSGYPFKPEVEDDSSLDLNFDYHVDNCATSPFEEYREFDSESEDNDVKYDPLEDSFEVNTENADSVVSDEILMDSAEKNGETSDGEFSNRMTSKVISPSTRPVSIVVNPSRPIPIKKSLQIKSESVHSTFGPVSCCGSLISDQKSFSIHKKKHHSHNSEVCEAQCTLCNDFIAVENIEDHIMSNQRFPAVKMYKCDICGCKAYTNKCRFLRHLRSHDAADKDMSSDNFVRKSRKEKSENATRKICTNICEYCEMDLKTQKALINHLVEHDPLKYQATCDECGVVVKTSLRLRNHKRRCHRKPEDYNIFCEVCNKGFKCQSHLKLHKQMHLLPERSLVCKKCDKSFANTWHFTRHLQRHEDVESSQEFKCPECGKRLKHRFSLQKHILTQHKSKNVFICDQCGKTTKNRTNMRIHMQVHDSSRNVKREYQYKPKQTECNIKKT